MLRSTIKRLLIRIKRPVGCITDKYRICAPNPFTCSWSFVVYGNWLGLLYLRLEFGSVFLLTVENRFGLFYLRCPPSGSWIWSFFAYGSPTVSKGDLNRKTNPCPKHPELSMPPQIHWTSRWWPFGQEGGFTQCQGFSKPTRQDPCSVGFGREAPKR